MVNIDHKCQLHPLKSNKSTLQQAGWPNGKALDYESRDCRFDPCVGHLFFELSLYRISTTLEDIFLLLFIG
ncbi:hypothetical protein N7530_005074 [Penicillium desertorum]|uniref:Uncharacterized protein n=1 Tax=Penicillium desertorum TaxID=1303715 RepID=A0A9W9WZE5_9EURO|nr:hypothetical protein N7530_005074 [Penicillium desertorum]